MIAHTHAIASMVTLGSIVRLTGTTAGPILVSMVALVMMLLQPTTVLVQKALLVNTQN